MNYFLISIILSIILILPFIIYISWTLWDITTDYMKCISPYEIRDHRIELNCVNEFKIKSVVIEGIVLDIKNDYLIVNNNLNDYTVYINDSWVFIENEMVIIINEYTLLNYVNLNDTIKIYGHFYCDDTNVIYAYKIYLPIENILFKRLNPHFKPQVSVLRNE